MNDQTNPSPNPDEQAEPAAVNETPAESAESAEPAASTEEAPPEPTPAAAEPEPAKSKPEPIPGTAPKMENPDETPEEPTASPSSAEPEQLAKEIPEGEIQRVQPTHIQQLTWWQKMVPGKKRDAQLADIQSGYSEVLGLVRSMRDNLDSQVVGQKKLVEFMSELPGVAEGLRHVGEAAVQQKEMLGVIKEQMDTNVVQNANIVSSMDKFNGTLNTMDGTTRKILEGARETEDSLKDMLERSERRLMWMTSLAVILLLAIGGGIFYLFYDGKLMVGPYSQERSEGVMAVSAIEQVVEEEAPATTAGEAAEVAEAEEGVTTPEVAPDPGVADPPVDPKAEGAEPPTAEPEDVKKPATEAAAVVEDTKNVEEQAAEPEHPKKRKKWFNINLFGQKPDKGVAAVEAPAEGEAVEPATEEAEEAPEEAAEPAKEAAEAKPEEAKPEEAKDTAETEKPANTDEPEVTEEKPAESEDKKP